MDGAFWPPWPFRIGRAPSAWCPGIEHLGVGARQVDPGPRGLATDKKIVNGV
jgi:hypothetical protein